MNIFPRRSIEIYETDLTKSPVLSIINMVSAFGSKFLHDILYFWGDERNLVHSKESASGKSSVSVEPKM